MSIEVRCFIVPGSADIVLVDVGPPGTVPAIGEALARVGAGWSDVSDIVLTHRHFDHTAGLAEAAQLAPRAAIWAGTDDAEEIPLENGRSVQPLADGDMVGGLHVVATPGHTPGHVSLLHEAASILLIGDLIGSQDGALVFGPAAFTMDPEKNRRSLRRVADLLAGRILFSHGAEVSDPGAEIRRMLDRA